VHAWALKGDFDETHVESAKFSMEWPPRSGRMQEFPEVDRAAWFALDDAPRSILPAQATFLDRLKEKMEGG
jgi:predicted NUDIX family NTP pyrophosphohydrolase